MAEKIDNWIRDQHSGIPVVVPEGHFILADISQKVTAGEAISEKEINILRSIYRELQNLDKDFISRVNYYSLREVLSWEEWVSLACIFLINKQLGKHVDFIKDNFISPAMIESEFEDRLKALKMPDHSRAMVLGAYRKILAQSEITQG